MVNKLQPSDVKEEFMKVYDACADGIFRYCYFRVHDREKALDLMQEAFSRTWQALDSGKQIANIRAFTYRVARNLIIDDSRKKKFLSLEGLFGETEILPDSLIVREDFEGADDRRYLQKIIRNLRPKYREAVLMRYVEGLTPSEIGEILNESANAVSLRLNRAIKEMRKLINYER